MKNTTSKLESSTVRHAKPKDKLYRLRDGGGLSLDVFPTGTKVWRYAYRFGGKQKTFTIGNYPDIGLSDARTQRDEAKKKVSNHIDPSLEKQVLKTSIKEDTFKAIGEAWTAENLPDWSGTHATRVQGALRNDVYPVIGDKPIQDIIVPDVIAIIKTVANRGAVDSARRIKGIIGQVFSYAINECKCGLNPARDIDTKLFLPKTIEKHFAAIVDPVQLGALLRAIDTYGGNIQVRSALKLAPLLALRPSELTSGEWCEIDFNDALWVLPAKRRKLPTHLKKANRPEDAHIIPLSSQAIAILEDIQKYTGSSKYIFTGQHRTIKPISNNALRLALRAIGYSSDDVTPHGFRATFSTLLNTLGYRSEVIEAQLAHKEKNAIRAAYNHADYLEERKTMMQEWSNYLDSLRTGANVIPIKQVI